MTLSVCCLTDAPERTARVLPLLRRVADEIVVAVDTRSGRPDPRLWTGVADHVLSCDYRGADQHMAWLHEQCSGDWVLRIDSDEVPSRDLLERLPALMADEEVRHYWIPTRWLYPDGRRYLIEEPWWPDFHNRLVRKDESLHFPGMVHTGPLPVYPARYVEEAIYHLQFLLLPRAARAAKARGYDRERPALRTEDGRLLNQTYYLPESARRPLVAAVPSGDEATFAWALGGQPAIAHRGRFREVPDPWSPAAESWLVPARSLVRARQGQHRTTYVRVVNRSDQWWPGGFEQAPQVRLGYKISQGSTATQAEGPRSPLPSALSGGGSCVVPVSIQVPDHPGKYELEVDLVEEHVRWFGEKCHITLHVTADPSLPLPRRAIDQVGSRLLERHSYLEHGPRHCPLVALTFDDGPTDASARLLDLLGELEVPATFFVVGDQIRGRESLLRRAVAEGHELANHGRTHRVLLGRPLRTLREARVTNQDIQRVTGARPRLFRAPYGYVSPVVVAMAGMAGLTTVQWDVDSQDWQNTRPHHIVERVLGHATGGSMVLLHDLDRTCKSLLEALPPIVRGLQDRGLAPTTASELLWPGVPSGAAPDPARQPSGAAPDPARQPSGTLSRS